MNCQTRRCRCRQACTRSPRVPSKRCGAFCMGALSNASGQAASSCAESLLRDLVGASEQPRHRMC